MSFTARMQSKMLCLIAGIVNKTETEIISGAGSREKVGMWCKDRGYKCALVVTGKSGKKNKTIDKVLKSLDKAGVRYVMYDGVKPNPTISMGAEAAKLGREHKADVVIAFGGGSPIDCAKLAAAAVTNKKNPKKLIGNFKVTRKPLPIVAIPTTAGSGSEVSIASVISDDETSQKALMVSAKIIPVLAVLDGETMVDLSPYWTAATGFDSLTHAVESYISAHMHEESKRNAMEAVSSISKYLKRAFDNGKDVEARNALAVASLKAGLAMSKCSLGYAHGFGHRMTGYYDLPHGQAVGMFLPHVLEFSKKAAEKELSELAIACGLGEKTEVKNALAGKFVDHVHELYKYVKLPAKCEGLKKSDYAGIIKEAFKETNATFPVPKYMTKEDAEALLDKVRP